MISKSLKFWHNWFQRKEVPPEAQDGEESAVSGRKHPAAITVRAAMRQKQKLNKAAAQ